MKKFLILPFLFVFLISAFPIKAQNFRVIELGPVEATESSAILDASSSAQASPSAKIEEKIQEKSEKDITVTTGPAKSKLAEHLEKHPIGDLSIFNFMQYAIRFAVGNGVPANMLVLLLLFPVVASLIAASRHLLGLRGFGVYTPAVLAVALLSAGIITGLILFGLILLTTIIARMGITRLKLQYLPRSALMIWFVSLMVFGLLLFSPYLLITDLVSIGIFPILVLVLLVEDFTSAQFSGSLSNALQLTFETLFLAVISALVMSQEAVQQFVILRPEITVILVAAVDIAVGKYTGLRIAEFFRFKPILSPTEEE